MRKRPPDPAEVKDTAGTIHRLADPGRYPWGSRTSCGTKTGKGWIAIPSDGDPCPGCFPEKAQASLGI